MCTYIHIQIHVDIYIFVHKYTHKYGHILTNHFSKVVYKNVPFSVQILDKIENNGRNEREVSDTLRISLRKSREIFRMLQLRTPFAHDVNDHMDSEFKKEYHWPGWQKVSFSSHKSFVRNKRKSSSSPQFHIPNHFLKLLCKKLDSELPNLLKFPHVHLMSMNKSKFYKTVDLLNRNLDRHWYHDRFFQCLFQGLDVIESKIL